MEGKLTIKREKIFYAIILVMSLSAYFTDITAQNRISFGVKTGISFNNMTSINFSENNIKSGFFVGFFTEIPMNPKLSIQPEIVYSTQQGTKAKNFMLGGPSRSIEYTLSYIQFPILVRVSLFQNFSVEIGPSINFLIKGEQDVNSVINTADVGKKFEFSGVFGVSYRIKRRISVSLRYIHGFTVALDRNFIEEDAKNIGFQFGVGLRI